jgi:phosphoribosylformimino-5-aminoimidazole carboxamide ribotide isomerase
VYGEDPVEMARRWQSLGAGRLHVVDLDGARSGDQANSDAVRAIVDGIEIPVELGGGVRDIKAVRRWLEAGVERVYLGTAAILDPALVSEACERFPGHVAAAADVRNGRIVMRGWEAESAELVVDFARRTTNAGVSAISYTNVSLDGTFEGPDIHGVGNVIEALGATAPEIILAGGVGSLEDVRRAAAVPGLAGVIIGRALYEGRVDLAEALLIAAQS